MKAIICCVLVLFCITGCVTLSEKAKHVQVHTQVSNLLDNCKRIGPVSAVAASMLAPDQAVLKAKIKLREKVADIGGDTVAILNTDILTSLTKWEASIQGVAFKCY